MLDLPILRPGYHHLPHAHARPPRARRPLRAARVLRRPLGALPAAALFSRAASRRLRRGRADLDCDRANYDTVGVFFCILAGRDAAAVGAARISRHTGKDLL